MQGKTPKGSDIERFLKRLNKAFDTKKVTEKNRFYKDLVLINKEAVKYVSDKVILDLIGLSATENINETETKKQPTEYDTKDHHNPDNDIIIDNYPVSYPVQEIQKQEIDNDIIIDDENEYQDSQSEKTTQELNFPKRNVPEHEVTPGFNIVDNEALEAAKKITVTDAEIIHAPKPKLTIPDHLLETGLVKSMHDIGNENAEYYKIRGGLADFLGKIEIKPKESVAITLDAEQGAGKTRLLFRAVNTFADAGYRCLFNSLEEHPDSALFKEKRNEYIAPQNQDLIHTVGDLPNGFDSLKKLIPYYDVIFIDSWSKYAEINRQLDFDRDLRKAFDGKLFVVIFQRTADGKMRGGSKSAFDGDIIMRMEKSADYKDTYAYFNKHRYDARPLADLKYNLYSDALVTDSFQFLDQPESKNTKHDIIM